MGQVPRDGDRRMSCINCKHWSLKETNPAMARMGFAQCLKKTKGHTMSGKARECERFAAVDEATSQSREGWLNREGKKK